MNKTKPTDDEKLTYAEHFIYINVLGLGRLKLETYDFVFLFFKSLNALRVCKLTLYNILPQGRNMKPSSIYTSEFLLYVFMSFYVNGLVNLNFPKRGE